MLHRILDEFLIMIENETLNKRILYFIFDLFFSLRIISKCIILEYL